MPRSRRVLVVEDEALVAMLIQDLLADLDCEVAALASTAAEAVDLARSCDADFALLDVNLGGGSTSFAAAEVLLGRGLPFAFVTGYGAEGVRADLRHLPVIAKPIGPAQLARVLGIGS
jgi:CheY-like chemotaxis protein